MLSINSGIISYGNNIILKNVNLEIPENRLSVIIGPNGSGKTTLINVLSGNKKLKSGIYSNNFKKSILIPQTPFFPQELTLFEYVSSVFYDKGWKWSLSPDEKECVRDVLEKLNLLEKKHNLMNQLSGGELQLANVALCLISGSDLILLDEPAANLDLLNQMMVFDILKKLTTKNITIVAIMHDINLASKYGDRFIILYKDGTLLFGDKLSIICKDKLCKSYEVNFKVINIGNDTFVQPDI